VGKKKRFSEEKRRAGDTISGAATIKVYLNRQHLSTKRNTDREAKPDTGWPGTAPTRWYRNLPVTPSRLSRNDLGGLIGFEVRMIYTGVGGYGLVQRRQRQDRSRRSFGEKANSHMGGPYSRLLTIWCDALVAHQVVEIVRPGIYGGILCPACARIHGRSADAVYPLMYMAHATGESRYLDAAQRLQAWSDLVSYPDGSWCNEPTGGDWRGITVFGAIALAEALRHHGAILDVAVKERWTDRLARAANYLYESFDMSTGVINYPITCAAAMAVAADLLGRNRYVVRARELAHNASAYFTKNHFLYGEGIPQDGLSPAGCRPIDLGYNVEESLPALVIYGKVTGDEEVLDVVTDSLRAHLEFMLPDGAWDNSWGTRNFKWTYWGSRTSDGCQPAYALLADRDPRFAEAAVRNLDLLDACTHDGLLYGGPHYYVHGELPCIHHTFCHAKALATTLDYGFDESMRPLPPPSLPREAPSGLGDHAELGDWLAAAGPWRVRAFPETRVWLAAVCAWRATVTGYDWHYQRQSTPTGGALSMLWHERVGALAAASMTDYWMVEPPNMQPYRDAAPCTPLTPRLECQLGGVTYRNINHDNAAIRYTQDGHGVTFTITGKLVDADGKNPEPDEAHFLLTYRIADFEFAIAAALTPDGPVEQAELIVPIISANDEQVRTIDERTIEIAKPGGGVRVATETEAGFIPWDGQRIFHHVPGFEAIPVKVLVKRTDKKPARIQICVE